MMLKTLSSGRAWWWLSVAFPWTLSGVLSTMEARADFYLKPWTNFRQRPKSVLFLPEIGYYVTSANYGPAGSSVTPMGFEQYTRIETNMAAAYGLNKYLTAFARLSWARIKIEHTLPGEAFGLTDQTAGITVHAFEIKPSAQAYPILVDFQFQFDFPGYSNKSAKTKGSYYLGDGSFDYTGGAFVTWPFVVSQTSVWNLAAGGGYTYRSDGFSAALPWTVEFKYSMIGRGPWVSVGANGVSSLKTDVNTRAIASLTTAEGAGGSYIVNAINPSLVNLRGIVGYRIDPSVSFSLAVSQTLWGQNAPSGLNAVLGMQAQWGEREVTNPSRMNPIDYGKSNQGFVNYTFEGHVLRVNDRMNLVKIDKGSQDGVEIDQVFDIFMVKQNGAVGDAVARAKVTSVKSNEAALTVTEYFKEVWIEEGFMVKRPIQ
jgi:hypothetical protein